MRVAIDTSPLIQTRAGTARHVRGLLGALRDRPGIDLELLSFGGTGRLSSVARDALWYPIGLARRARAFDVLHCTTFRGPAGARVPTVLDGSRPRDPALPRGLPAVASPLREGRSRARASRRRRDRRGLRVHEGGDGRAGRCSRRAHPRRSERRRPRIRLGRASSGGRLCPGSRNARAAEEPEPGGRGGGSGRRRVARGRRSRLGRRRRSRLGGRDSRRAARCALSRCALRALPVALRGLRSPRARGDGVRNACRHFSRGIDCGGCRWRGDPRRSRGKSVPSPTASSRLRRVATSSSRSGSRALGRSPGSALRTPWSSCGGSWHERGLLRRRRPRAPADGRRDLRAQPAARARAPGERGGNQARRDHAPSRPRSDRGRAVRVDGSRAGAPHGLVVAARAPPPAGRALPHAACPAASPALPVRRDRARPFLRTRPAADELEGPDDLPHRRSSSRPPCGAGAHGVGANEGGPRRALRRPGGEDRRRSERRRPDLRARARRT